MKNILVIALLSMVYVSFAQKRTTEKLARLDYPNLKISYFGNWNYPGLKIGSEFMLRNVQINPRKGRKPKVKQSYLTLNAVLYDHYEFRTNLMVQGEYLFRKTYSNGVFAEFSPGVGYSKGLQKVVPTYLQNTDGTLSTVKPDNTYWTFSLLGGFGYDFEKNKNLPFKAFFKTGMLINSYHQFVYAVPITEVGIITNLSTFRKK